MDASRRIIPPVPPFGKKPSPPPAASSRAEEPAGSSTPHYEPSDQSAPADACRLCGADIRGVPADRACPSCHQPVGRSLPGDYLRYAPPAWLKRVALGLVLMAIWIVAILVEIALPLAVAMIFDSDIALVSVLLALAVARWATGLTGYCMFTSRDRQAETEGRRLNQRRLARFSLFVPFSMIVTMALANVDESNRLCTVILFSGVLASWLFPFLYAIQLARRIPDPRLVKESKAIMWGMLLAVVSWLIAATLRLDSKHHPSELSAVSCFGVLLGLVMLFLCVRLIIRFRRAILKALRMRQLV